MKVRMVVLTLAMCFLAGAVCFASDVQMGTWKLNEAKSKIAAGAPKNSTVVYEPASDGVKVTIDGTAPDGIEAVTKALTMNELVVVAGSIFLVGPVRERLLPRAILP